MTRFVMAVGTITARTSAVPALRASVKYAAFALTDSGEALSVNEELPTNGMVSETDANLNIVPCAIGDPCLLMRHGARTRLIALTEKIETDDC